VPEGDTIFRTARTLQRALAGQVVTGFETQLPKLARVDYDHPIAGRTVESVSASGKWLLIKFSGDLVLLTHMLMSGSWHIYRPGEKWQRGRDHMRVAISTANILAVAFNVPVAEFHTESSLARRPGFNRLGPDILVDSFDHLEIPPDLEIGVALVDQSIVAGIGNMFKSEVCFLAGVNPFRRAGDLTRVEVQSLVSIAREVLKKSAEFGRNRLWVYHRAGEPCRKCGAVILTRKQGPDARVTFWCPICQV